MTGLGAWHGSQELKDRIVARMRAHRAADDLIQGDYQLIDPESALGYRGCAIGCALDPQPLRPIACQGECCEAVKTREPERGWHGEFRHQFGIDADVASVIDDCFEALLSPDHAAFAVDALEAIPAGADLSDVWEAYWNGQQDDPEHDAKLLLRLLAEAPQVAEPAEVERHG